MLDYTGRREEESCRYKKKMNTQRKRECEARQANK
jgi:hypothetical protein